MKNWAKERAKDDKAKGIYILICPESGRRRGHRTTERRAIAASPTADERQDLRRCSDSRVPRSRERKTRSEKLKIRDKALNRRRGLHRRPT